jgi:membrane protein YdbS with pleckstrin-like domain
LQNSESKAIFIPEDPMADSYLNSLLGDKEEILLVDHQHWLVLLEEIASELLLSLVIIVVVVGLSIFVPLALIGLVVLIAPLASLTRDVLRWSNRKYVITNRRVIQISGVLNKDVVDSSLEKVNDVMLDQSFMGRIFGFGDIEVLTASEIGVNKIRRIAHPVQYKIAMVNAKAKLEGLTGAPYAGSDVPALISQLDALRQKGVINDAEFQEKKAKLMAKI